MPTTRTRCNGVPGRQWRKIAVLLLAVIWALAGPAPAQALAAERDGSPANPAIGSVLPGVDKQVPQEAVLLRLVNQARISAGMPIVTRSALLDQAAAIRAREIANDFRHNRPDGSKGTSVLDDLGIPYRKAGQNIIRGQQLSAENAFRIWMQSAGERNRLLSGDYRSTGIARVEGSGSMVYWVQIFTD